MSRPRIEGPLGFDKLRYSTGVFVLADVDLPPQPIQLCDLSARVVLRREVGQIPTPLVLLISHTHEPALHPITQFHA